MEAPHLRTERGYFRGCLIGSVSMIIGVFLLGLLWTLFIDSRCVAGANTWLPAYPEATEISAEYTFLRMHGIGRSVRVLITPDDLDTVEDWYRASDRENGLVSASRGGAFTDWDVEDLPQGGTQITLFSQCARNLDLSPLGIGRGG